MTEPKSGKPTSTDAAVPFFSIIIPVYNASAYLAECMECLLAQDFRDWEAILVDDASSDSSLAIAEDFSRKDDRIKVFRSDSNSGGAYTPRVRAAKLSRGRYIVTVDADDIVSGDLLSSLYSSIQACNADLVIPEMWRMTASDTYKILPSETIDTSRIWKGMDLVKHTLVSWEIPMCGFAIKRDIYLEADSRVTEDDRRSIFADELLSRWLLHMSDNVAMCSARYIYRQNEASVTHVNLPRIIFSRMHTCDGLIAMADKTFGRESDTFESALANKLYSAVDLLRDINRSKLDRKKRKEGERCIAAHMKGFDFASLQGKTSPRYLALMQLPMPAARQALRIIDRITGKKHGI